QARFVGGLDARAPTGAQRSDRTRSHHSRRSGHRHARGQTTRATRRRELTAGAGGVPTPLLSDRATVIAPNSGTAAIGSSKGRRTSEKLSAQLGVPVDVLVKQVPEPAWATRVTGLRAEGAQPHEVALLHLDPVFVEQIHRLALEDIKAVLHHVG